jgi:hypothetical protein
LIPDQQPSPEKKGNGTGQQGGINECLGNGRERREYIRKKKHDGEFQ